MQFRRATTAGRSGTTDRLTPATAATGDLIPGRSEQPLFRIDVAGDAAAELKNTICLTRGDQAFLSQHIGDLKNVETFTSFEQSILHFQRLLQWQPEVIAHDLHPDYQSTLYAQEQRDVRIVGIQHHHAHLVSCMAENGIVAPCIGVIFDGIGYGDDGHIWGGEFLLGDFGGYRRVGHFAYLPMPGGDAATREPYRMALSALNHAFGEDIPELDFLRQIDGSTLDLLRTMLRQQINCPLTSSCGRLFDGVAALVGLATGFITKDRPPWNWKW